MDKYLIDTLIDFAGVILIALLLFIVLAIYIILTIISQKKDTKFNHHINIDFDKIDQALKELKTFETKRLAKEIKHNEYLTERLKTVSIYKSTKTKTSNKINTGLWNMIIKIALFIIGLLLIVLIIYFIVSNPINSINEQVVVEVLKW